MTRRRTHRRLAALQSPELSLRPLTLGDVPSRTDIAASLETQMKKPALLVLALLPTPAMAATVDDTEAVRMVGPQEEIVSPAVPADERDAMTAEREALSTSGRQSTRKAAAGGRC